MYTQPKPHPYDVTNFTWFDQSEATFEMSCGVLGLSLSEGYNMKWVEDEMTSFSVAVAAWKTMMILRGQLTCSVNLPTFQLDARVILRAKSLFSIGRRWLQLFAYMYIIVITDRNVGICT